VTYFGWKTAIRLGWGKGFSTSATAQFDCGFLTRRVPCGLALWQKGSNQLFFFDSGHKKRVKPVGSGIPVREKRRGSSLFLEDKEDASQCEWEFGGCR